jgi:hypothetical protein
LIASCLSTGGDQRLYVRVDIDEHEARRVAVAFRAQWQQSLAGAPKAGIKGEPQT